MNEKEVDDRLLRKASLDITLLPETKEDIKLASLIKYEPIQCNYILKLSLFIYFFYSIIFFSF